MMSVTKESEYILSVRARNTPGVLLRIAGLFSRRCYNILSIVASQTEDEQYSEMIIVVQGDDRIVRQVDKQLSKLQEIEQVNVLSQEKAVVREHLLLRVKRTPENSEFLVTLANAFHASILQVSPNRMILELVGDAAALNSLIELCRPYQIEQILRTGAMAMSTQEEEVC